MLRRVVLLCLLAAGTAAVGVKVGGKSYATEKRVDNIVTQLGQLNLQALAQFQSKTNTAFLAGLSQLPHQTTSNAGGASTDSNTGPYWGTGERDFINTDSTSITGLANALNTLQSNLQARGFEA